MKTRTQLLVGILGLNAFISLPALAQNPVRDPGSPTAPSTQQRVPATPSQPLQNRTTPSDAAPATQNLVEQAASNDQFTTLAAAIEAAGLAETLSGEGPYTVFAPTDAAFAALPEGILDQLLLPENRDVLVQLLKYHVVSGSVTSSQLESGEVETLVGQPLLVQIGNNGTVSVNNATVTQADIQASNGVIHVVDQVILPPQVQALLETAPQPKN